MLGATYDPCELARMGAVGIQANLSEACKWYARAAELGSPEAAERLATLGGS
jgi:TPR repeat protein